MTLGAPREVLLVLDSVVISEAAGKKSLLVVAAANKVEARRVELGPMYQGFQTIVSGLQKDDWVILGSERLKRPASDKTCPPRTLSPTFASCGCGRERR